MLYNSFGFIFVFLPVCLASYFLVARWSGRLANTALTVLSLVFYGWWNWHNLFVLVGSIALNFLVGSKLRRKPARPLLIAGIAINLVMLGFFKYGNFVLWNISQLTGHDLGVMRIALPLGISFFTFTQIAFLVDCYRRQTLELDAVRYGLFVTFFPHLIAGPIVHHRELMPQFAREQGRGWVPLHVHLGIAFFVLGLFKKVVIADTVGPWANAAFEHAQHIRFGDAWRGALAYTMQLYFDFSGYCDMAIGLGMFFNVRLPDNFDAPYRADSIVDFWRRWHITLSRFLRDYLYIPLGGNRRGEARRRINLLITMLLGGIWHGAGWTFVIWGAYHGILLSIGRIFCTRGGTQSVAVRALSRALTFLAVVVGWVFFRAANVREAGAMLAGMMGLHHTARYRSTKALVSTLPTPGLQIVVIAALIVFVNVVPTTSDWVETRNLNGWRAALLGLLFVMALFFMRTALLTHRPSQFIYFQF